MLLNRGRDKSACQGAQGGTHSSSPMEIPLASKKGKASCFVYWPTGLFESRVQQLPWKNSVQKLGTTIHRERKRSINTKPSGLIKDHGKSSSAQKSKKKCIFWLSYSLKLQKGQNKHLLDNIAIGLHYMNPVRSQSKREKPIQRANRQSHVFRHFSHGAPTQQQLTSIECLIDVLTTSDERLPCQPASVLSLSFSFFLKSSV